jgi:hypothetical protein
MTNDGYRKEGIISKVITVIALAIYYFAFIMVSFGVYQQAHAMHHAWVVADALNGITGGFILVYPFNIFRKNGDEMLSKWKDYVLLSIILTATASVIGGNLGLGGFV